MDDLTKILQELQKLFDDYNNLLNQQENVLKKKVPLQTQTQGNNNIFFYAIIGLVFYFLIKK